MKNSTLQLTVLLISLIVILSSCQSTKGKNIGGQNNKITQYILDNQLEEKSRVRINRVVSWQSLKNRFIVIKASFKTYVLIEVSAGCFDLNNSNQLAFNQDQEYWLNSRFDEIILTSFGSKETCQIARLFEISKDQRTELINLK